MTRDNAPLAPSSQAAQAGLSISSMVLQCLWLQIGRLSFVVLGPRELGEGVRFGHLG